MGCFIFAERISTPFQVLQKLLKFYLQRRDKVLLFSLSTKVRAVFVFIEIR